MRLNLADQHAVDAYVGWWTRPGRILTSEILERSNGEDSTVWTGKRTPGALTIVQAAAYDPGNQAHRFHSAINATTAHASLFGRMGNQNPFTQARQFDMGEDRLLLQVAIATADVVHCHISQWPMIYAGVKHRGQVVMHYHGSDEPGTPQVLVDQARDTYLNAIQIGARLDHAEYGDLAWVPMTQPVHRLDALRQMYKPAGRGGVRRPFRIAHAPTVRAIKGTDVLLAVVDDLRAAGVKVEVVLIEGHRQEDALAWKATCDACFDSFWLGLQGSGLEAGAMGMPVIAGDERTKRLHEARIGYCPYLFADTPLALADTIVGLIEDNAVYDDAAATMRRYVWHWHAYDRVAAMYLDVLAERSPELRARICAALDTPHDGASVPAIGPMDDAPWLAPYMYRECTGGIRPRGRPAPFVDASTRRPRTERRRVPGMQEAACR